MAEVGSASAFTDGSFVVELDRFSGPLDLLLHLIREQNIDIFDIPISQITAQFLRVVREVDQLGLDRAGEFLEVAATLVRIKAQMLLPRRSDALGQLEDPRAELVRRLLEYEHFREASLRLAENEADRARRYRRGHIPPRLTPAPVSELVLTWEDIMKGALRVGARPPAPEEHRVTQRTVPIEDKIGLITQTLHRLTRIDFRSLIKPFNDKLHAVVTFLAGLELSKRRQITMRQNELFGEIWLYRRKLEEEELVEVGTDAADANH